MIYRKTITKTLLVVVSLGVWSGCSNFFYASFSKRQYAWLLQLQETEPSTSLSLNDTTPHVKTDSPTMFQGSKITSISPGMDLMENVCIFTTVRKGLTMTIHSYTENENEPLISSALHHTQGSKMIGFTQRTVPNHVSMWHNVTDQYPLVEEETLFTFEFFKNPGHCLNDLVHSIALDAWYRKFQGQKHDSFLRPLYQNYVAGFAWGLGPG